MSNRRITRRRFLQGAAGASSFTVLHLASGGKIVAQSSTPAATGTFQEAPALADLVAGGALPPVNERLPQNPLVVEPTESIGQYGGTLRSALLGGSYLFMLHRLSGYENLVRWSFDWNEVIPNIASAYEANADSSAYTFTLRPGMKWSDGQPFTADDILFYVNDVVNNPTLGTNPANPFTAEKVDDFTVTITLERPDGLFLKQMCTHAGEAWNIYPKHYLSQFHEAYAEPEALDDLIAENEADDWGHLFRMKGGTISGTPYNALWQNPELPRLHVWSIVQPYGESTRVTMERNPYYFKVDPEGNQLPYIDGLDFEDIQDAEVLLLKTTAGEMDLVHRSICTVANKSVLAESRESGGYNFFDAVPSIMNTNCYKFNMTHKDPVKREIFQNRDFRIGMSYAINRQEVIDTIYVSQGEPWQAAPLEGPYFNETLAKQYTEYDVDLANEHLDKVLPEKDGDGWRLRSDGERLTFVLEVNGAEFVEMPDAANLVISYWREVGVDCQMKVVDRALFDQHVNANDDDVHVWPGGSGAQDALLNPYNYMPMPGLSFAKPWYNWWKQPAEPQAEPEEPIEPIKQQFALYDELTATADPDEHTRLLNEILVIAQENFWVIGIGTPAVVYGVRKNTLKNIPDSMWEAAVYPSPGPANPAQYYFES